MAKPTEAGESEEYRRARMRAQAAMAGAKREGAIAAGTLIVHFTWYGLQDEMAFNVAPAITKRYGEQLIGAGLFSKKKWGQFCEENIFFEFLPKHTFHLLSEISEPMRKVVVDVLSRSGGVRLPRQAAARGQLLLKRYGNGKPLFTAPERRVMKKALGAAAFPIAAPEAMAALEKAEAAGGASGLEALLPLAGLVACMAHRVVFDAMSDFMCPCVINGYASYAEDDCYTSSRNLPRLDESEESASLREDIDSICAEAAAKMSDMLGWVLVDILSDADGLELTAAGARRALTLLQRHEAEKDVFPGTEQTYVHFLKEGAPSCQKDLEEALQKMARAKETVES